MQICVKIHLNSNPVKIRIKMSSSRRGRTENKGVTFSSRAKRGFCGGSGAESVVTSDAGNAADSLLPSISLSLGIRRIKVFSSGGDG
jgi:hypothetical protein